MTALPYQPVPTAHQRRELERLLASDRAKRYAEVQGLKRAEYAAQLRYEMERLSRQPEPVLFVAPVEDAPEPGWSLEDRCIAYFICAVIGVLLIANFLGLPA